MLGQIIRFSLTGLVNTLVDFGLFNLLLYGSRVEEGWWLLLFNLLATGGAALNSYFMNRYFTFGISRSGHRQSSLRFVLATGAGMLINSLVVMLVSTALFSFPLPAALRINIGKILGSILSATWNFFTYRHWVFPRSGPALDWPQNSLLPGLVSLIIPAYNENRRLPLRLEDLAARLPAHFPLEIIVVDDGSTDGTAARVQAIAQRFPLISCLSYQPNRGKGGAVNAGMRAARGEYLLFCDADDSFSRADIVRVVDRLKSGAEIAIACRQGSRKRRSQGERSLRTVLGKGFNLLVQGLFLPGLKDSQCGLKGFQRRVAEELFARQRLEGFAFDVEILALARLMNFNITELPVRVKECAGSRVHCLRTPLHMLRELFFLKIALLINDYRLPGRPRLMPHLAAAGGLFVLALAVRLPWLWEIPRFIDELKEVHLGYLIYQGEALPLHNAAHDIGALHNYILAGIFKVLGPSILWPRLYVACTAAFTVVLVFYLGRRLYGQWAGWLAALFLLANGMHILVTHMAWSNCTTPLFFTLALFTLIRAEMDRTPLWLLISALCWAAALQTHSSVIIYCLIAALYVLSPGFRDRTHFSPLWPASAALVFLAGYANMIYFNLVTRGGSLQWLSRKGYALEQDLTPASYLDNLGQFIIELLRTLASSYPNQASPGQYFSQPFFVMALVLLLAGAYLALKKGKSSALPLWMIMGTMLIMPLVNERYTFFVATRYIMPVVICAILLVSLALQEGIRALYHYRQGLSRRLVPLAGSGLVLLLLVQLMPFYSYCRSLEDSNASNRLALSLAQAVKELGADGQTEIFVEKDLPLENGSLPYLLDLGAIPYRLVEAKNWEINLCPAGLKPDHGGKKHIAVITEETYFRLSPRLAHGQADFFDCRITLPKPTSQLRRIYIVRLQQDVQPVEGTILQKKGGPGLPARAP